MKACRLLAAVLLFLALQGRLAAQAPAPTAGSPSPPALPPAPVNLRFEQGELGQVPAGWIFNQRAAQNGYAAVLADEKAKGCDRCVRISRERPEGGSAWSSGDLRQDVDATPYRGKRIRLRAAVRFERAENPGHGRVLLRTVRAGGRVGFSDSMVDRQITSPDWRTVELLADIEPDAVRFSFGAALFGTGGLWVDSFSLEEAGPAGAGLEPARALTDRGLDNLVAFTRLLGYVRYFHPSDAAAEAHWERLAVDGARAVEDARDAQDLARRLEGFFQPVAPTLRIFPTGGKPASPPDFARPAGDAPRPPKIVAWRHYGVDIRSSPSYVYWSRRINNQEPVEPRQLSETAGPDRQSDTPAPPAKPPTLPRPEDVFQADLPGGVSVRLPIALYADAAGTLPRAAGKPVRLEEGRLLSGNDRATRLANVALAWNIFQHFYPYFDEVQTDWPETLRRSLRSAATDKDQDAFVITLQRLVADLHDGHGSASGPGQVSSHRLPVLFDVIEGKLAVTHVDAEKAPGVARGSLVLGMNGRPIREVMDEMSRRISAAGDGWRNFRLTDMLASGPENEEVRLELQAPSRQVSTVSLRRTLPASASFREPRPEPLAEIQPGIFYIDFERVTEEALNEAYGKLAAARGVIIDGRGYPQISTSLLGHLMKSPGTSAQWRVPIVHRPDREDMTFDKANWEVTPEQPRIEGKVAFLTDGGAISYAETFLGIAEHYKLGEIVGAPTAGTNGNVNPFSLPGGYQVMWTGMKVLKHDGSRHHGVGIRPTVPVARTLQGVAAGRDEILEKAIAIVGSKN